MLNFVVKLWRVRFLYDDLTVDVFRVDLELDGRLRLFTTTCCITEQGCLVCLRICSVSEKK